MLRNIGNSIRSMLTGIKNLVTWAPVIYRDRDWDYGYLEDLLMFKFKRMANCIEANNLIEANKRVAKQIRYASYLLQRLDTHEDETRIMSEFEDKWGKSTYEFIEHKEGFCRLVTTYPKAATPELEEQCKDERLESVLSIARKEQELYERFFKHWAKYHQGWWD